MKVTEVNSQNYTKTGIINNYGQTLTSQLLTMFSNSITEAQFIATEWFSTGTALVWNS